MRIFKGILFASRAIPSGQALGIADVTASIRALVGGAASADAAGKSFW